jgi:SAM-dependent methyltransferase
MLRAILRNAGLHPRRLLSSLKGWQRYCQHKKEFQALATRDKLEIPWGSDLPILTEWDESAGSLGAYFFQDQWVARQIHQNKPVRHVDVGSRIDGFIGSVSVFREIEVIDIRPQPVSLRSIKFHQLDLMRPLPSEWLACTDSLSCLHTIEHFGLGRYGDPLDPTGHLKGLEQLKQMVKPGGRFYLSTPIGPERIEFNAHRIFAAATLISWFTGDWEIETFTLIDDQEHLHDSIDWNSPALQNHFGCRTGLGIVVAKKKA